MSNNHVFHTHPGIYAIVFVDWFIAIRIHRLFSVHLSQIYASVVAFKAYNTAFVRTHPDCFSK